VLKQISLLEITSTAVLLANAVVVVVDLSRVFHVVDSATLQAAHRCTHAPYGMLAVLPTISSPQVVPSRRPFKQSERHVAATVFLLCSLHFVREMRLGCACNTSFHCQIFRVQFENSFSLDTTTVMLSRVITASFHPETFYGV